jgi:predicted nucleotidyltransferase
MNDGITALMPLLAPIVERLAEIDGIAAIALGGSHACGTADEHSDIDLALYYDPARPFAIEELNRAAANLDDRHLDCLVTNFGEWGPGVNGGGWLIVRGRHVDLLYRDLSRVREALVECREGRPSSIYQLGHPLGFPNQIYAAEVDCCRPLHDPANLLAELKRLTTPYPEPLRLALIKKHLFDARFEVGVADKPAARGDTLMVAACAARTVGFLTLVLYALNRRYFINEKGAMRALTTMPLTPPNFSAQASEVLGALGDQPDALARSLARLIKLIDAVAELAASAA